MGRKEKKVSWPDDLTWSVRTDQHPTRADLPLLMGVGGLVRRGGASKGERVRVSKRERREDRVVLSVCKRKDRSLVWSGMVWSYIV